MFKPFYIHKQFTHNNGNTYGLNYRGFSALIEPHPTDEHLCFFRSVKCHKTDEFNKKKAREALVFADIKTINKRDVGKYLAEVEGSLDRFWDGPRPTVFDWVYKFML